jgi:hypothetical protein
MLSGLLQIRTFAGTIERNLALLAATLRANAAVDSRTEAFLLANLADGAAQTGNLLCKHYGIWTLAANCQWLLADYQ